MKERISMKKRFSLLWEAVLASVLLLGIFVTAVAEVPNKTIEIKGVAKKCLTCHHPSYEKIREATAKYKTFNGETVTPHQYVPHKDKTDIPDCTECHEAHPIPPTGKVVKPKDISFCYTACHHMNDLQSCTKCH
jgi:hypothetical protein